MKVPAANGPAHLVVHERRGTPNVSPPAPGGLPIRWHGQVDGSASPKGDVNEGVANVEDHSPTRELDMEGTSLSTRNHHVALDTTK